MNSVNTLMLLSLLPAFLFLQQLNLARLIAKTCLLQSVLVGTVMIPIRIIVLVILHLCYYSIVRVVTLGLKDEDLEKPLSPFRRKLIARTGCVIGRIGLYVLGFWRIDVKGSYDPRATTIVSNHGTFLDILFFMSELTPSFVAKDGVRKVPFIGYFSRTWQSIFAPSEVDAVNHGTTKTRSTANLIKTRQTTEGYPPLIIFPEGTTTNGQFLIQFRTGAFLSGMPVQPVLLKYPSAEFSPTWETISVTEYMLNLMSQFSHKLEATYMPMYIPTSEEKADPALYAKNVQKYISKLGNIEIVELGIKDKVRYHKAIRAGKVDPLKQVTHVELGD